MVPQVYDMKINKLIIDTTNSRTELCDLGVKYPTDKSPYNNDSKNKHIFIDKTLKDNKNVI